MGICVGAQKAFLRWNGKGMMSVSAACVEEGSLAALFWGVSIVLFEVCGEAMSKTLFRQKRAGRSRQRKNVAVERSQGLSGTAQSG